jgi:hypothetical protein
VTTWWTHLPARSREWRLARPTTEDKPATQGDSSAPGVISSPEAGKEAEEDEATLTATVSTANQDKAGMPCLHAEVLAVGLAAGRADLSAGAEAGPISKQILLSLYTSCCKYNFIHVILFYFFV